MEDKHVSLDISTCKLLASTTSKISSISSLQLPDPVPHKKQVPLQCLSSRNHLPPRSLTMPETVVSYVWFCVRRS